MDNTVTHSTRTSTAWRVVFSVMVLVVLVGCAPAVPAVSSTTTTTVAPVSVVVPVQLELRAGWARVGDVAHIRAEVDAAHPSGQVRLTWSLHDSGSFHASGTGGVIDQVVGPGVYQLVVQARSSDGGSGAAWAELVVVPSESDLRMLEAQVLSFVNQERAALNAAPLAHDAGLATAAASWSQEMARSGIRHDPGLSAAMVAGGFSQMGEVLHSDRASRSDGGAAIVASWRGSSRHWAILTDPTATLAGFGLHVAVESGDGATLLRLYATGRVGSLLAGR